METKTMHKVHHRTFFIWGVCSSLGVTYHPCGCFTLVGLFIGSTGLAVANIATPGFLLILLMGNHLRRRVQASLIGKKTCV